MCAPARDLVEKRSQLNQQRPAQAPDLHYKPLAYKRLQSRRRYVGWWWGSESQAEAFLLSGAFLQAEVEKCPRDAFCEGSRENPWDSYEKLAEYKLTFSLIANVRIST